jgi:hypothetical protein
LEAWALPLFFLFWSNYVGNYIENSGKISVTEVMVRGIRVGSDLSSGNNHGEQSTLSPFRGVRD